MFSCVVKFWLLYLVVLCETKESDKSLELKLVHVIFRHGARTPERTYPNDPYLNETFEPFGLGQLTNTGKQQMFELGEFLRNRYDSFLGENFKLDDIYAHSTNVDRTKMSLQLVLAGMFPPKRTSLEWNQELNWQPIPFVYESVFTDMFLMYKADCPRYDQLYKEISDTLVKKEFSENAEMIENLTRFTGMKIKTFEDIQFIYSTLKSEKEYGLELPQWTNNYFPKQLLYLTNKNYFYNFYNSEMRKLKGGVFLQKAIRDWKRKINNKLKTKIFVNAGHDVSVAMTLTALNVYEQQFPDYASTAILEFKFHRATQEYGVEIFLRNSTSVEPYQLTIPGCEKFCTLKKLVNILSANIPKVWKTECKAQLKLNEER